MKIGITERGDAALDLSWVDKLDTVDGAILITKNVTSKKFQEALLENKDKLILHATITFLGGTEYEPNVPKVGKSMQALKSIIDDGFPASKIVFRLDPILCYGQAHAFGLIAENIVKLGISRVRFSFIDMYPHVKNRFASRNLEIPEIGESKFTLKEELQKNIICSLISSSKTRGIDLECCAENSFGESEVESIGCISQKDLQLLGIYKNIMSLAKQREGCKCLSVKTELLTNKAQCPHGCVYCYWKA